MEYKFDRPHQSLGYLTPIEHIEKVSPIWPASTLPLTGDTICDSIHRVSRFVKLVEKILRRPAEIDFRDVERLLKEFGYESRPRSGGSHYVFVKSHEPPITVPKSKGRKVKRVYIERVIDRLNLKEWYEERTGREAP